ncbi:diguanylate cyclase [Maridesulfovibrio sp.]|uniref:diguanylate cyclase n=1 Tax=Maridesulfovibrio sp. TaxID=2795000 RepID=UPI0029F48301|nr:diguanylate cyclase [Maridesulfovibrio sp.]
MFYFDKIFEGLFSENTLCRKFVEATPDAIAITDAQGSVLAGNSRAAAMLGYAKVSEIPENASICYKFSEDRKRLFDLLEEGNPVHNFETEFINASGDSVFVSLSLSSMDHAERTVYISTLRDISERKKTEAKLLKGEKKGRLNEIRFDTLSRLAGMSEAPLGELYDFTLEAAVRITRSDIGYVYFLNEDETQLRLYAWSKKVMPMCAVEMVPDCYNVEDTGVWGDAIRQRKPVILNDYEGYEGKQGLPEGHVPISRHMNVPLFDDGKIVLLTGVANKEEEYQEEDVRQVSLLMEGMWNIVRRKESAEALRHAYAEMESMVEKRTEELSSALTDLRRVNKEISKEIRQRRTVEKRLRQFERLVEVSPDLVSLIDRKYCYVMVNDSYVRLFNKPKSFFLGKSVYEIVGRTIFDTQTKALIDEAFTGKITSFEAWIDVPSLGKRYFSVTYHPVDSSVDEERLVSITAHDITEQQKMLDKVKLLASTDPLTGANNRRYFMDRAVVEMERLQRYGGGLFLMMLDIDHFKYVNDSYGHNTGDLVLKEFVKCCHATLRKSDVFGRLGGEEFAALLVHGTLADAQQVAERLRRNIESLEVHAGGHVVKCTVSIGLTSVRGDTDVETVLKLADKCLYQAKDEGRNRVVSYSDENN